LKPTDPQPDVRPRVTRDGRLIRYGPDVMPGPDDTYMSYGRNWANVSNTPFKEYKHFVHEGGISTPLIAHWPRGIERKGSIQQQPGHLIDIMPTCLALAGADAPPELPGVSLLPAFRGESLKRSSPIFFEHEGNRAVRAGRWKLVATGATAPWELYDMQTDRTEMHDLSNEQPERAAELAQAWERWAQTSNVLPLTPWKKPPATTTRASR
jgi:arylsulfatase